jgi:hypothetical protein
MLWCSEITSFKLENKQNKQQGEGKMDFIFKRTYYLPISKVGGINSTKAKIDQESKISR